MKWVWRQAGVPVRRLLHVLLWLVAATLPAAAVDKVQLHTTAEDGYGRLVLEFPGRLDLPDGRELPPRPLREARWRSS